MKALLASLDHGCALASSKRPQRQHRRSIGKAQPRTTSSSASRNALIGRVMNHQIRSVASASLDPSTMTGGPRSAVEDGIAEPCLSASTAIGLACTVPSQPREVVFEKIQRHMATEKQITSTISNESSATEGASHTKTKYKELVILTSSL